jgi:glucokinase
MEDNIKIFNDKNQNENFSSYVLGIDVGGTNTNLAVAGIKNSKPILLFSINFKTNELDSLVPAINKTLTYAKTNYDIETDFACIGVAGVVSNNNDYCKLTNANWDVSSEDLISKTALNSVYIINDFQTVGFGLNLLNHNNENDIFTIKTGKTNPQSTKIIIGAGTGLGKSILIYNKNFDAYIPIPCEGGHVDFPIYNDFEFELSNFVKKLRNISYPLTYEELISGRGIEAIYLFLRDKQKYSSTEFTKEIDEASDKTPLISKYRKIDEICKETFRLFTRFYGRCAKNFTLDTLAGGGLYIAGGIAVKNKDIFTTDDFKSEFINAYRRNDFLEKVPINVILNYDVSLYGACYAAMYKLLTKK